jgi:SAM-dependent methyltransferase
MSEQIDHIERWRRIVAARREQHDTVCAQQGRTTDDYWSRRAEGFQKFVRESAGVRDPFLDLLVAHLRPDDVVLDAGAGTGRHTLPLARHVAKVIALDPSAAMLRFLREELAGQGIANVEVAEGGWPDAAERLPQVDVAISAHVLYPIEDVVPFLRALDRQARRRCFLHLMVWQPWFDQLGLWEAVHPASSGRLPQPVAIDAVNVLYQLGCYANVDVAWVEAPRTFDSLDDAFERVAETVAVGDDADRRARLREALAAQLDAIDGGRLRARVLRYPLATVWWEAGALQKG